jgi:hypothetical protein
MPALVPLASALKQTFGGSHRLSRPLAFLTSWAKIMRYKGPLHGEEITLYWHDIVDIAWAGRSELMRC